ncbi:phosphatase PAP2 family protein [Xanthobacter sp. AM11]|uniref:phosphatase PAP2 family protein n=1 Tax=Xanthobacter sp. AM11 TaxID=3380643 RepID=UPI0039BF9125
MSLPPCGPRPADPARCTGESAAGGSPRASASGVALRRLADAVAGVIAGLFEALAFLLRHRRRGPSPRVGLAGVAEGLALAALTFGLVAAAMILVDPLVPGLRLKLPAWLVILSDRLTDLGFSGVVLWPLGLGILYVLALVPALDAMGRRVAASMLARLGFLFLAIAPVGLLVAIVKHLLGRARPHAAFLMKGPNPQLTFDWLVWKSSFASFPSGHSTTAFAAAVALAALFPRARVALIALAVPVAATRIVLGSHYPSDVIAGAAIGTAWALWMVKVFAARRLVFQVAADGRIAPMAGPSARRLGQLLPHACPRRPVPLEEARP